MDRFLRNQERIKSMHKGKLLRAFFLLIVTVLFIYGISIF